VIVGATDVTATALVFGDDCTVECDDGATCGVTNVPTLGGGGPAPF
jgi:hypothetical protein